jgi:NADH-quinone oxidoreductase subunit I
MADREIPENAHAIIGLDPKACTSCMICVRECPVWCIDLASHTVEVTEEGARRPKVVHVLDEFTIDLGACMFCGICVDVCPFDALAWSTDDDLSARSAGGLVHGIDQLVQWFPASGN